MNEAPRKNTVIGLAWLVLIVPVLAVHWRLLAGELPLGGDLISQFIPWRRFALGELTEGRFPWWNPYIFCGTPFAANIQTSLFYPLNLLHILVRDPERFFSLSIVLHHILAGAGMYLWQRSARARTDGDGEQAIGVAAMLGPLAAALIWQWSAFLICHTHDGHLIHLRACAWLPWVFWGQDRLLAKPSAPRLLHLGLPFALTILGGHIQIPLYAAYLLLARGLVLEWSGRERLAQARGGLRGLGATFGGLALAGGLAAFVLLPLFELSLQTSTRVGGASLKLASSDSLPVTHLPLLWTPFLYGDPASPMPGMKYWGGYTGYHELAGYMGIFTWCLIPFAWLGARRGRFRRENGFWLICMAFGLVGALGQAGGIHTLAYHVLPGYAFFRVPGRLLLIAILGGAVLASRGLDRVGRGGSQKIWPFIPTLVLLGVTVIGLLAVSATTDRMRSELREIEVERTLRELQMPKENAPMVRERLPNFLFKDRHAGMAWSFAFAAGWASLSLMLLALLSRGAKPGHEWRKGVLAWLAIAVLLADLLWFASRFVRSAPPETVAQMSALDIPPLAEHRHPSAEGRVLMLDPVILTRDEIKYHPGVKPNRLMNHGIETVRGYDPITLTPFAVFVNRAYGRAFNFAQGGMLRFGTAENLAPKACAALDLGLVVGRQEIEGWETVWRDSQGPLVVSRYPGPRARVFLVRDGLHDYGPGTVTVREEHAGRIEVEANTGDEPALLVWSQVDYPGWQCTVDGKPAPVEAYLDTFVSVALPPGESGVVFEFAPSSFKAGLFLTALSGLGIAILTLRERRRE